MLPGAIGPCFASHRRRSRFASTRLPARATTATTWRGVPLGIVATRRPAAAGATSREKRNPDALVAEDSARARRIGGPMLAATAAQTWLKARTLVTTRPSDGQPGGPEHRPQPVQRCRHGWKLERCEFLAAPARRIARRRSSEPTGRASSRSSRCSACPGSAHLTTPRRCSLHSRCRS